MIVPMKKVSLVVLDKHREESLRKLRKIGVIHLERKSVSSDSLAKLMDRKAKVETVLGILQPYEKAAKAAAEKVAANAPPRKPEVSYSESAHRNRRADDMYKALPFSSDLADGPDFVDPVSRILEYADERKAFQEKLAQLGREQSRVEEWGNFDPDDFALLAEKAGLSLFLYKFPRKGFVGLPEDVRYVKLGEDKNAFHFLVLDKEIPGEAPVALPEQSLKEINVHMAEIHDELANIEKQLALFAQAKSLIEREAKVLLGRVEFETARAGMDVLADVPSETAVSWITGFVPQEELGLLKRASAENGWALAADDPGPDDAVPTKLKHNRFVKLLNPLTDFLEVAPGYEEADISPWFLIFFTVFFGMIFGDAAYGAIFVLAAVIGILKTIKKGVPSVIKLLLLLGSSNLIWGILTCTWFGMPPEMIPVFLQKISLPLISNITAAKSAADDGIVRQNLMIFCFSLALLQLSIGHIIAITRCRTLKVLGDVGSIAMLAGMYGIVLSLIASNEYRQIPLLMPCVYALGGGFVLNFAFTNYDGSVGKSIVESLKNFISMILGIANVFSDIMSYIRLWAVGLAGAAISSTVNSMAGPMLGHFIFFVFGVLLLVFGHGLNLVLNALSVLVHGVRLNTLEFSSHVGLTWAGTAYKPFSEKGIPPSREVSGGSK